jgi:outer membrane immunogenic protein
VVFGAMLAPAAAADMPIKAPRYVAPLTSWSGFYAGLDAGLVNSQNGLNAAATPTLDAGLGVVPGVSEGLAALSSGSIAAGSHNGFIGGGQVGYNWQLGSFVAGIETDIQGISQSGGARAVTTTAVVVGVPVASTQTATMSTKDLGTVRARLGFLLTPTWLVNASGGLAYGGADASTTLVQSAPNGFGSRGRLVTRHPRRVGRGGRLGVAVRTAMERQGRISPLRSRRRQLRQ